MIQQYSGLRLTYFIFRCFYWGMATIQIYVYTITYLYIQQNTIIMNTFKYSVFVWAFVVEHPLPQQQQQQQQHQQQHQHQHQHQQQQQQHGRWGRGVRVFMVVRGPPFLLKTLKTSYRDGMESRAST